MSASSYLSLPKRFSLLLISLFIYLLAKTLRVHHDDAAKSFLRAEVHQKEGSKASFFLFWHNQLLLVFLILIIYKKKFPPFSVMVSANKDGDFFAALLEKFGYATVRGSANNKSLQALKGIHKAIKLGNVIAYAADGPTGPVYQFKPGAVFLSHKYQVPIDLVHLEPSRCIRFKTWDRLMLPLPFTKVRLNWLRVNADEFCDTTSQADTKEGLSESVALLHERMSAISGK